MKTLRIMIGFCFLLSTAVVYAESLSFEFSDPVGDQRGRIDVTSMTMSFDNTTGNYEIVLTADEANPFVGDFRVNINLFNPDTGSNAPNQSFFSDTLNDFSLENPTTTLKLADWNWCLTYWQAGDRVATSSGPFGNPRGTTLFRSAVSDLPGGDGYREDEDTIAFEEFTVIEDELGEVALLPVALVGQTIPGAWGSRWITEFHALNSGEDAVDLRFLTSCVSTPSCENGDRIEPGALLNENGRIREIRTGPAAPAALIRYPRKASRNLHFELRVRDVSRQSETAGTEIPVVREPELFADTLHLVDIPVDWRFRCMLRVYGPDQREGVLRLTVFDMDTGERLFSEIVMLLESPLGDESPGYQPRYSQRTLTTDVYPDLIGVARIRLELDSLTNGLRFWAFVSVTNDATQHVTTVTPQ